MIHLKSVLNNKNWCTSFVYLENKIAKRNILANEF